MRRKAPLCNNPRQVGGYGNFRNKDRVDRGQDRVDRGQACDLRFSIGRGTTSFSSRMVQILNLHSSIYNPRSSNGLPNTLDAVTGFIDDSSH